MSHVAPAFTDSSMIPVTPRVRPPLDLNFVPAVLWNRGYQDLVAKDPDARRFAMVLVRTDGTVSRHETRVLSAHHRASALTLRYAERLLKFLLWQKGGYRVLIAGAGEVAAELARGYRPTGPRAFDHESMGSRIYGQPFSIAATAFDQLPESRDASLPLGRHLDGCRIGFDLGGSDRKVAALIEGKVVFAEEVPWNPYFEPDPSYHLEGVQQSLARAAAHLPRVDAIGGSAAGVYVNNEVRVASLFRGVSPELFDRHVRRMFFTLQQRWGGVPFEVANDGEVTALAGSMSMCANAVLGLSMGTSQAAGYVTPDGSITPWLNELAFAPIDYRTGAPRDEWSGDLGCGVQYLSQQAVGRLAPAAGFDFPENVPLPERLIAVQQAMAKGNARALTIYETIGTYLGYAIAHYADFYELKHILVLGRVTSGPGGDIILTWARNVLTTEFPAHAGISLRMPGEEEKRVGQAIAAASLPAIGRIVR
ncbi:MAG: ROK family protein [Opitutaceae bacterium]|nr:ROK family protein [Opitutaceae bacterium]